MKDFNVPGAIVGISVPGKVEYVKTFGIGDKATNEPMDLDDHVRIGSVTKTFTGTAVLQLVDQKRVRLTDPISKYVGGIPKGDQITLRMLGEMRSGIFPYTSDEQFGKRFMTEIGQGPSAFAVTAQELVDIAAKHPLNFEPGTKFEYSNTNTVLLGMVVEKVTGQPLAEYLKQHVIDALRLAQTSYPTSGNMPAPFAHGETNQTADGKVADATFWNPSWGNAAGAMISTYADLKTWAVALGKGTLLSQQTQRNRVQGTQAAPGEFYGFAIFGTHGWVGHNGSIPGYTTVAMSIPDQDATLVVSATTDIAKDGKHPADYLANVVTTIATPDHVYALPS
jgi:D-alanyl-D-alanine carboxypeptidase